MKKHFRIFFGVLAGVLVAAGLLKGASNEFTDYWTILGIGSLRNTAIAWIDSARDFTLYDGDIILGGKGATPSATAGEYPALKIPIKNDGNSTWSQGTLVTVDDDCAGCGKASSANDQTDWIGFSEGTVAHGSVGYVIAAGYALALTTGTVNRGDVLVSTATTPSSPGYVAADTTPTTGADVAVAIASGTTAGGLTAVKVR